MYKEFLKLIYLQVEKVTRFIPDELYIRIVYRIRMGNKLNLDNPKTFDEKLQWLKLYDRNPIYTTMVDKYAVKKYVANLIGEDHIIPTLGIWEHFDEIDFNVLPDRFVLKCTHDSGGIIIVKNKNELDKKMARRKIENSLKRNFYWKAREWPYKNVKPCIIAEEYMENTVKHSEAPNIFQLRDYKIHCFSGKPEFIQCICDRNFETHRAVQKFFTTDWKDTGWTFEEFPSTGYDIEKPDNLEEMLDLAQRIARDCCYARIDMYDIGEKCLFGEVTFTPLGGFHRYKGKWNEMKSLEIGSMIKLPE